MACITAASLACLCVSTILALWASTRLDHVILCCHEPVNPCRKKLSEVNKKLGDKFEISETELLSTVDACKALMEEGQDIDTGAASTQVRTRHLRLGINESSNEGGGWLVAAAACTVIALCQSPL